MTNLPADVVEKAQEVLTTGEGNVMLALFTLMVDADDHKHHFKRVKTAAEIRKYGPRVWSYCTICKGYKFDKTTKGVTWG